MYIACVCCGRGIKNIILRRSLNWRRGGGRQKSFRSYLSIFENTLLIFYQQNTTYILSSSHDLLIFLNPHNNKPQSNLVLVITQINKNLQEHLTIILSIIYFNE